MWQKKKIGRIINPQVKLITLKMELLHLGVSVNQMDSMPRFCFQMSNLSVLWGNCFLIFRCFHHVYAYVCIYNIHVPVLPKAAVQRTWWTNVRMVHSSTFMTQVGQSIKLMPNQIWNEIIEVEITSLKYPATGWQTGNQNIISHL